MKSKNYVPQFMEMFQLIKIQLKRTTLSSVSAELSPNRTFSVFHDVSMCFVPRLVKPGVFNC